MGQMSENILLMDNRIYMYRLLGRLYKEEIDRELYDQLASLRFNSECDEGELSIGYREFEAFFHKDYLDPLTDLAVDYARVFLGAGIADATVAFPYESVYTSTEHLIMQDARDEVLAMYREFGLDKDESLNIPEDHIGLELEFMAHLCLACKDALSHEDFDKAEALLSAQSHFLQNHLLNWVLDFSNDLMKCSQTTLYKAIGKITCGYLHLEQEIVHYLSTAVMISARKVQAHEENFMQSASASVTH